MSLTSGTARIQYTLTSTNQALAVPFKFINAVDLSVVRTSTALIDTTLVLNTHYTVSGGGSEPATGTVTMVGGAAGEIITICRGASLTQPAVYNPNDRFPAKTTETAVDRSTMHAQQLALATARSLRFPNSNGVAPELALLERRQQVLGFDINGNPDLSVKLDDIRTIIIANPVDALTDVTDYGSILTPVTHTADYGSILTP